MQWRSTHLLLETFMGYSVRLQKVERPTNRSYYVNLPVVLAETLDFRKGDILEWSVLNPTTLSLHKIGAPKSPSKRPKTPKVKLDQ